jgi:mono/diheme cytochrome c family protein
MNARWLAMAIALLLSGCERQMHDMYAQPRYDTGRGSTLFRDGRADRPPVPGTVPTTASEVAAPPVTKALLLRGQERYAIYCLPCHSPLGDGDGPVARHGFPRPPTYHQPRLRNASDRYLFDVITNGHGVMYGYADRVSPEDRWAIVAYVRALQLSQDARSAGRPR